MAQYGPVTTIAATMLFVLPRTLWRLDVTLFQSTIVIPSVRANTNIPDVFTNLAMETNALYNS